jgi:hypothetical protein
MNEDFAHKSWIEHHATLAQGIDRAVASLAASMKVLHDKQFAAPWRAPQTCDGKAC